MLVYTVIVAGDGSGSNVYVSTDLGIAQIRKVICL